MTLDMLITWLIGLVAALYVGFLVQRSARRLLTPRPPGSSACGGCSGCGTEDGHAKSEQECTARATLVVLGKTKP